MTTYTFPANFKVSRFELRILPNTVTFTSPYTRATQTLDFMGERWGAVIELDREGDMTLAAAREAFFDRLKGQVNLVSLWNIRFPQPQGTLRDGVGGSAQWKNNVGANANWVNNVAAAATWSYVSPVLYACAQNDNVLRICTSPGQTLLAGDMFGAGTQLFRAMATATADSAGILTVEVLPRVRTALPNNTPVTLTKPTANFMLKTSDGVPVPYVDVFAEASSFELIEAF